MKRILVTGASGFIGRHCLAPLIERGFEVCATASRCPAGPRDGVVWYPADLFDDTQIGDLLKRTRPTHLLHLAWIATPGQYLTSPENLNWVVASVRLLQHFAAHGGRRIVSAGTCLEYDTAYGYCREDATPERPTTVYGACKLSWHTVLRQFAAQQGLEAAWGRVFHLYGPGEDSRRLVPSVIRSLLGGETARCTHGLQIRDFMHVADVAQALTTIVDSSATGPVNVGTGQPVSIRHIVSEIAASLNAADRVEFGVLPTPPGECPLLVADASRLQTELGFSARYNLSDGLRQTIASWPAMQEA